MGKSLFIASAFHIDLMLDRPRHGFNQTWSNEQRRRWIKTDVSGEIKDHKVMC